MIVLVIVIDARGATWSLICCIGIGRKVFLLVGAPEQKRNDVRTTVKDTAK